MSGRHFHDVGLEKKLGATVVPLFELVYRDCIAMYGKYGYDPAQAGEYVLHHISIGRPLNYHSVPPHLYWKEPAADGKRPPDGEAAVFTRADNGWAAGLHPLDRFVKNTHEVLSPLNELTAQKPMSRHQFLTPDRRVQRSVFGEGAGAMEVIVNAGRGEYRHRSKHGGEVVLPPGGFLVESREFAAFHALSWGGRSYEAPVLFTLRSLDGRPLERSRRIRVFHAFGDAHLRLGGTSEIVNKERVIAK